MDAVEASSFHHRLDACSSLGFYEICGEMIERRLHLVENDPNGEVYRLLEKICQKAYEFQRDEDICSIYDSFTTNLQELGQILFNKPGRDRFFLVTDYAVKNVHFASIFRGALFLRLMMYCDDIKALMAFVTSPKVPFHALQHFIDSISNHLMFLSSHPSASKNLFEVISFSSLPMRCAIYHGITSNLEVLGQTLLNQLGRDTIFHVTNLAEKNIQFAGLIQGDLFMRLMRTCDDVKPLIAFVTTEKVPSHALQPLFSTIFNNIVPLSRQHKSSTNLCDIIANAPAEFNYSLVKGIQGHLFDISKLKKGNFVVQSLLLLHNEASALAFQSLKGTLMILAKLPYARFVVQCIFEECLDEKMVLDSFSEIVLDDLLTHCVGHFVHQSCVRRLESLDVMKCRMLCSDIVSRRVELTGNQYGYQVFVTCRNLLQKIGK